MTLRTLAVRMRAAAAVLHTLIWVYWSAVTLPPSVSEIWARSAFTTITVFRKVHRNRPDKPTRYEFGNRKSSLIKVFINSCSGSWEELLWLVISTMHTVNYDAKECQKLADFTPGGRNNKFRLQYI